MSTFFNLPDSRDQVSNQLFGLHGLQKSILFILILCFYFRQLDSDFPKDSPETTRPLVAMAEIDNAVEDVTDTDIKIITNVSTVMKKIKLSDKSKILV